MAALNLTLSAIHAKTNKTIHVSGSENCTCMHSCADGDVGLVFHFYHQYILKKRNREASPWFIYFP